jgi:hypothetical protein
MRGQHQRIAVAHQQGFRIAAAAYSRHDGIDAGVFFG